VERTAVRFSHNWTRKQQGPPRQITEARRLHTHNRIWEGIPWKDEPIRPRSRCDAEQIRAKCWKHASKAQKHASSRTCIAQNDSKCRMDQSYTACETCELRCRRRCYCNCCGTVRCSMSRQQQQTCSNDIR